MNHPFNASSGPILVDAEISGPAGKARATLVLDTGATASTINISVLRSAGYDPNLSTDFVQMMTGTGTGVTKVPRVILNRMSALGQYQIGIRVLAHDLPLVANVDGPLGLDFLRDQVLTIDFRAATMNLV
ncbi:MAG TPA: aspartyl protease family protein [Isosphaeraceae bacterium]|nr:aspartyl protease family protein [Isosphaeraceae bacterium]